MKNGKNKASACHCCLKPEGERREATPRLPTRSSWSIGRTGRCPQAWRTKQGGALTLTAALPSLHLRLGGLRAESLLGQRQGQSPAQSPGAERCSAVSRADGGLGPPSPRPPLRPSPRSRAHTSGGHACRALCPGQTSPSMPLLTLCPQPGQPP